MPVPGKSLPAPPSVATASDCVIPDSPPGNGSDAAGQGGMSLHGLQSTSKTSQFGWAPQGRCRIWNPVPQDTEHSFQALHPASAEWNRSI